MRKLITAAALVGAVAALRAGPCEGADWPGWRGADRDGRSPDTGLLKSWPDGGPRLLWKATDIGKGFSSVAIAGGVVYISGDVGNEQSLHAYDLAGRKAWSVKHGPGWSGRRSPGAMGSPVVSGGKVYLLSGNGLLKCYDARTGAEKWSKELVRDFGGKQQGWGYSESPLIYKTLCIVKPGGSKCVVALNKDTGETVWTSTGLSDDPAWSSCIAVEFQGQPLIITTVGKRMVGVDARTGQLLWENRRAVGGAACTTPVYSDGYVFSATGYGNGGACVKLALAGGKVTATQVWETKDMICHHGGFIVHEGHIYGNHEGGWNCLDLKTGEKKWGGRGVGKGSVCYADGMLYTFGEGGGRMGLLHAKPDGFQEAGQFRVQGRAQSWAYPVVVGGRMYVRYDTNLYVYDVRGPNYREAPVAAPRREPKPKPAVSRPKPPPMPRREARPDTSDERARRLWNSARNFLANNLNSLAEKKLKDLVEKYPDSEYAAKARDKLKELAAAEDE